MTESLRKISFVNNIKSKASLLVFFFFGMIYFKIMDIFIKQIDKNFVDLHKRSCEIIRKTPAEKLFWKPIETYSVCSVGEYILRSSGKVEQTFGGITSRLWDDPFEWALPEELSSNKKILDYLNVVEETRINGFNFFKLDEDLKKEIPAPEKIKTLFELLIETLAKAENYQGRAISIMHILEKDKI